MLDAEERVTGRINYTLNIEAPAMLVGKILRSHLPHARIVRVDVARAQRLSGVSAVLSRDDFGPHTAYSGRYGRIFRDQTVVAFDKVTKTYGHFTAVKDFTLSVEPGETVGLLGPNGAGKTTVVRVLTTLTPVQHGQVSIFGLDSRRDTMDIRSNIGYVPQQREIFPPVSVREHLAIARRPGRWSEGAVLELFPSLAARLDHQGRQLSGGEQQMLAIARALLGNPTVL